MGPRVPMLPDSLSAMLIVRAVSSGSEDRLGDGPPFASCPRPCRVDSASPDGCDSKTPRVHVECSLNDQSLHRKLASELTAIVTRRVFSFYRFSPRRAVDTGPSASGWYKPPSAAGPSSASRAPPPHTRTGTRSRAYPCQHFRKNHRGPGPGVRALTSVSPAATPSTGGRQTGSIPHRPSHDRSHGRTAPPP